MASETGIAAKKSTTTLLMELLDSQVELAEKTRVRVAEKLEPVLDPNIVPCDESAKSEYDSWPPFFNNVRDGLDRIYEALYGINRLLDRCEL